MKTRIEIDKRKVKLASETKESRIILQDTSILDDESKKWFPNNKEINEHNKGDY